MAWHNWDNSIVSKVQRAHGGKHGEASTWDNNDNHGAAMARGTIVTSMVQQWHMGQQWYMMQCCDGYNDDW